MERGVTMSRLGQPARALAWLRDGGSERRLAQGRDRERVNMTRRVPNKYYDKGGYDEKAERRRSFLKDI